jgi:hypothetical protein
LTSTAVILGAELLALKHRLLKRGPLRLAAVALVLVVAAVFIGGGAFAVGVTAGQYLPGARDSILAGGFTALSVLMLVVGFPSVIATFFVGRDLLQLVLAPVRPIEIFTARLLVAMNANLLVSGLLLLLALGLGVGSKAPAVYFPIAVVLIVVQVLIATAFQVSLMSVVLRWVPARLARDVAAAVAGLAGAGFYLAWNLSLRQSFSPQERPDLSSLSAVVQRVEWLPSAWPGHALSAVIAGDPRAAAGWSIATFALGALLVTVAVGLYRRTLLAGLGVFGGTQAVRRRTSARRAISRAAGAPSPARAIAVKDWLGYRRDIRRLSRLLPALLFPIGYAFAFIRPSRGTLSSFWTEVFLAGFITMFMSTALATPSIPSERRGFQLLRMSPLSMWEVIRAKILLTLPPVLGLTLLFSIVVATVTRTPITQVAELAALVVWLGTGFVAVGVSAGGIDPRFDAADVRRAVGLVGTLAGLGGSLGFAGLSLGAFALFIFGTAALAGPGHLGPLPTTPAIGALMEAGGVVLTAGSAGVVALLLWIANSRLRGFEGVIETA